MSITNLSAFRAGDVYYEEKESYPQTFNVTAINVKMDVLNYGQEQTEMLIFIFYIIDTKNNTQQTLHESNMFSISPENIRQRFANLIVNLQLQKDIDYLFVLDVVDRNHEKINNPNLYGSSQHIKVYGQYQGDFNFVNLPQINLQNQDLFLINHKIPQWVGGYINFIIPKEGGRNGQGNLRFTRVRGKTTILNNTNLGKNGLLYRLFVVDENNDENVLLYSKRINVLPNLPNEQEFNISRPAHDLKVNIMYYFVYQIIDISGNLNLELKNASVSVS